MAKKKKKRLKIKNIIILFLILSILGSIIYYMIMLPINNVYVTGNNIIDEDEIVSLAKLDDYPSFILTVNGMVEKKILKNAYIDNVEVKKSLGNKIYIEVIEHNILCVLGDGRVVLSNGDVIDNIYDLYDVPYFIGEIDEKIYLEFVNSFKKIDSNILRQISQIEYSPTNVDEERFFLYMDDGNCVYITLNKIKKLNKYNGILKSMGDNKGIIYLDSGNYIEIKNNTDVIDVLDEEEVLENNDE